MPIPSNARIFQTFCTKSKYNVAGFGYSACGNWIWSNTGKFLRLNLEISDTKKKNPGESAVAYCLELASMCFCTTPVTPLPFILSAENAVAYCLELASMCFCTTPVIYHCCLFCLCWCVVTALQKYRVHSLQPKRNALTNWAI